MKQEVKIGQQDYTVLVVIRDTAGAPKTALAYNSAGLDVCYTRVETDNDVVLGDGAPATQTLTGSHTDWGFVLVDDTKAPGLYRLDIADEVFATGAWSAVVSIIGTGLTPTHLEFVLVPEAPYTGVNVSMINAVAASSVTAVNANIGTTQPINFHGTAASAYVKSDLTEIADVAVSTTTAQVGVNVVQISTDPTAADNCELFFDGTGYAGTNNVIPTVTTLTNLPAATTDWLTAAAVKADAVTKIQTGLATPTNITAGTITTVTNLTNAPTVGDFTTTMKTSLNAATPASVQNISAQTGDSYAVVTAIKTKTDYLPSVTAGAAGGVFIAGTNAATSITTALTANITGNLSGSVGSVATGGIAAASFAAGAIDATAIANGAIDNATFATDTVCRNIRSGATNGAGASTVTLDGSASSINNFYDGAIIQITAGDGIGQSRVIRSYVGSTKIATVTEAWVTQPTSATYVILPLGDVEVGYMMDGTITASTFASGAITADAIATDAIGAAELAADAVNEISTGVWGTTTRQLTSTQTFSLTGNITGNLSGTVGSVTGAVGSIASGGIASTSFATGAITADSIATDAIGAAELAADAANEIADAIMTRASSNWEASAPVKSLGTAVMKATHRTKDNAGTLEIYRSNGTTIHASQTITTDAANLPIDELTGAS